MNASIPKKIRAGYAVSLGVFADLSGTLATFMPMKSVFILAADDVPGFFPSILVEAGPVFAALSLVALAAVLAYLSGLATQALGRTGTSITGDSAGPLALFLKNQVTPSDTLHRHRQVDSVLLLVIALIIILASWVFMALTALWIASILGIMAVRLRDKPRAAPFISGIDELAHRATAFIQGSGLWSTVLIAIASLLIFQPPLGLTGILLAAVFGRRFQQILARIIDQAPRHIEPVSVGPLSPRRFVTNPGAGLSVTVPFDFLITPVGMRGFTNFLRGEGLDKTDFQVIGQPRRESLSLVIGENHGSQPFLLRMFPPGSDRNRDEELALRSGAHGPSLFPPGDSEALTVLGFPAIRVALNDYTAPSLSQTADSVAVAHWQVRLEKASRLDPGSPIPGVNNPSLQGFLATLESQLVNASRLPGPMQEPLHDVLQALPRFRSLLNTLSPCLVPERALGPLDFYLSEGGELVFLGDARWLVGQAGQTWGRLDQFEKAWLEVSGEAELGSRDFSVAILHAHLRRLNSSLAGRSLNQARIIAQSILSLTAETHDTQIEQ